VNPKIVVMQVDANPEEMMSPLSPEDAISSAMSVKKRENRRHIVMMPVVDKVEASQ